MLKSNLPKSFPTYRSLPIEIRNRWFRAFAQEFNWDPSITELVRTAYDSQAAASFSSNLHEWKKVLKRRGPRNAPEWMKARESLFGGYMAMWTEEKVAKTAAKNSRNRKSERNGLGQAIHNNGAKTIERRWDTEENDGEEPHMLKFIEDVHTNKKTRTIADQKAKKIIQIASRKIDEVASQRLSQGDAQPTPLTAKEINSIVLEEVPIVGGRRFGFGKMLDAGSIPSALRNPVNESLQDEIDTLKKAEAEKDAKIKSQDGQIEYLMQCNKLFLEKFPDIHPPGATSPTADEDETQE
ncbi:uncharacterized protein LOC112083536 isoform X2 [Eutrema salsugineum]|uniref:uncharacterized protein LOC112083536 isoform X2 n=1 Tax=Eutrema salsugineum TaxID=72664 RepID=UPI000CED2113|nr:uncharacterized protein LOC112083536 isoform X2 [Eutrema salsugineum]